ncbi:MAG: hypothetical protein Q9179_005697 [Wetmoreana sp. 5 TL-2023]
MSVELVQKVEGLSDLELALLLSFVANEHCLIQTEENGLYHLQQELQLVRLNDHIFLSHYHDLEDGFTNLESASEWIEDDRSSSSSVVRKTVIQTQENRVERTISDADVQKLVDESKKVTMTAGVRCYLQNIVVFLRQHRAVDGGITPRATKAFDTLARCLASLHGLEYVTPSLVAIAARKIYPHRIKLTIPERDRSLQYGSDLAAVKAYLEGVTPESIIEDVLAAVEPPL